MTDAPIEPRDFLDGLKVVEIGDIRVARGLTRRPLSVCPHNELVYDSDERRIWCTDCESEIHPFDAFVGITKELAHAVKNVRRREIAVEEAEKFILRSRAAKVLDEAWRKTSMAPLCPHCRAAILPEDVVRGVAMAGKALVLARRKAELKS